MALVACHECGHNISTTAKACPSCGAAPPPTPMPYVRPPLLTGAGWAILICGLSAGLLVLLLLIAAMREPSPKAREGPGARRNRSMLERLRAKVS